MARSPWLALLVALPIALQIALPIPLAALRAQDSELLEEWALQRDLVLVDAAQRHYDVGLWCWEVGMRAQATSAMLYSLEVSDGRFSRAKKTLAKMRALESDDWKKEPRRPNTALLRDHERRGAGGEGQGRPRAPGARALGGGQAARRRGAGRLRAPPATRGRTARAR
jgi:hypothetical protein